MKTRSLEFLREVEMSDADSRAVRMACGWAAKEIERLKNLVIHVRTEHWEEVRTVAGIQGAESLDDIGLVQACMNWVEETGRLLKDW